MAEFPINNSLTVTGTFTDANDNLFDPTNVKVELIRPNKTTTDYVYLTDSEVQRSSLGVYTFSVVNPSMIGDWMVVIFCDDTEIVKDSISFTITNVGG